MNFKIGSKWRKWDLHVHTPCSIVHDYKKGDYEDVWKRYFDELEKLPSDIKVLGINDYWFLDGYKKVKEYKDNGNLNNIDLILPVVEFRLRDYVGNAQLNKINYHIIFSNELSIKEIEDEFLKKIEISDYENRSLTKDNLIAFGEKIKNDTPENMRQQLPSSLLQIGFNNLTVSLEKINELLRKTLFIDKYIKAIGQTEWNDFRWDGSPNDKRALINGSNFIFSASPTINKTLSSKEKFKEQGVNDCLIHCSDAHEFYSTTYKSKVLGHCFTWIKADTTFKGLQQVIYEPQRIKLSEINPNQKNTYQYIESITLKDEGELFDEQIIGLSPDLNSIIGGKSSGKSLLLYHLAKAVMNHEKFNQIFSIDNFPKYDNLPFFELEAKWADGHISKLSGFDNKRPIVYIPQMYLNYMAEKKNKNEDFKQTINDILISNYGYKEFINNKEKEIFELEQKIDNGIREYFSNLNKLNILEQELHKLGDKNAIETNIGIINKTLEDLRNTSGFTENEILLYKSLNQENKEYSEQINLLDMKKKLFNNILQTINQIKNKIPVFLDDEFNDIKFLFQEDELKNIISNTINEISLKLNTSIEEYTSSNKFNTTEIDTKIEIIKNKITQNENKLKPLIDKINNLNILKLKEEELLCEQNKIKLIYKKIEEIKYQKQLVNIDSVIENYKTLYNCYNDIVNKNNEYKNISETIDLISEVSFNIGSFERDFSYYITKNRTLENIFVNCGFDGNNFIFNINEHVNNIQSICNIILNDIQEQINFNQSKTKEEIIRSLLKNYFDISYDLLQGSDRLGQMSPGKKGIILFQLFLHMSSSQDPILIDQPEDNLDNRTVYQELNDFIKKKKLQRQIIIVSHNSNLVVSTDSENVIVAHQNSSGINPKFEYINGSLENTFTNDQEENILKKQGIREHVCDILEGGAEAFKKRERKYNLANN